jgi:hypothetical protein
MRLDIGFGAQVCYIHAYMQPVPPGLSWPPADWRETRKEYMERMRGRGAAEKTPQRLKPLAVPLAQSWTRSSADCDMCRKPGW